MVFLPYSDSVAGRRRRNPMMLGNFLEISVHTTDVLRDMSFYRDLGFNELETGEVWSHPYGVVSDGNIVVGMHAYRFDSPSLTFVRPELSQYTHALKRAGVRFAFQKLADDEFNELGFVDPDGLMVTLLEARTHAPHEGQCSQSLCGTFLEFSLPVADLGQARDFWQRLGWSEGAKGNDPNPFCRMQRETLALGLHQARFTPALSFIGNDLGGRREFLKAKGFQPQDGSLPGLDGATLTAPDGTRLYMHEQDWAETL